MLFVLIGRIDSTYFAIAGDFLYVVAMTLRMIRLSTVQVLHLGIVGRQLLVEYADVFVITQRHTVGI